MKPLFQNLWFLLPLLIGLLLLVSACSDSNDDGDDPTPTPDLITFNNLTLTGAQEVPANNSAATGTFKGSYNPDTKVLSYTITFTGITPTAMHFHKAPVGQSGDVVIGINPGRDPYSSGNPFTSPIVGSTPALTGEQETDLLAGNWYLNIHSNDYPAGEIRVQLTR